jgi:hypothetical protein
MCASSAVSDYYMKQWPNPNSLPQQWPHTGPSTFPQIVQSDPELKDMLRKTIQLLDKIDKKLGDRDCKDETKAEFYRALDLEQPNG